MKKYLIILLSLVFISSMLFTGIGCRETITEAIEEVVEEVEEPTEEDLDVMDPWLEQVREPAMEYYPDLPPDFKGPNGQTVTWDKDSLVLTAGEVNELRKGNYKIAMAWHIFDEGPYQNAWKQGMLDAIDYLEMELIAETDAKFDVVKMKSDIETIILLEPDVLITAPIEPVSAAEALRPAVDAGIKISLVSNQPDGYERGKDYIGISTSNCYAAGLILGDQIGKLIGPDAKIGMIIWEEEYWFVNITDEAVLKTAKEKYPNLDIIEEGGFIQNEDAGILASAMIQRSPEIEGLFVSYMTPAMQVVSACQDAGRSDIKIITNNMDTSSLLDMVSGGNIVGCASDGAYFVGINSVITAAYGLLGKEGPDYAVCPSIPVTVDNLRETWDICFNQPIPEELEEALKKIGK